MTNIKTEKKTGGQFFSVFGENKNEFGINELSIQMGRRFVYKSN